MQAPSEIVNKFRDSPSGLQICDMIEDSDINEYGLRSSNNSAKRKRVNV